MKKILGKMRDAFCYCGLSRDSYYAQRRDVYITNYVVWYLLHLIMVAGYAAITVIEIMHRDSTPVMLVQTGMLEYSIIAATFFIFVFKRDSKYAQYIIYLSIVLLLGTTLLTEWYHPGTPLTVFSIMLVLLPIFVIGKPVIMTGIMAFSVVAYFLIRVRIPNVGLENSDMIVIICFLFGIFIHLLYNYIRFREFEMKRCQKDLVDEQARANEEMRKLNTALKRMSDSAVDLLGDVVEGRDMESGEHIRRVKGFTNILANCVMERLPEYRLDKYTVDLITSTAALHDVGKIAISDFILFKPGRLTAEEFDVMKTHCRKGCDILSKMRDKWSSDYLDMGMTICLSHHERWDGHGYPNGLAGDAIPIAAQIVAIADVFDALTTKRVYKDAYSYDKAFDMIMNGECGAFSEKLLGCLSECRERFEAHAANPQDIQLAEREYELISRSRPSESFVIGLHDQDRTLQEKLALREQVSVLESLSEELYYVCHVDTVANEVIRYSADESFTRILNSIRDLKSTARFDSLLNQIIVAEDYPAFRKATEREESMKLLQKTGHMSTDFRIRLEDGVHYCRMKISLDPEDENSVIIGIFKRDEEHQKEMAYLTMQKELEIAHREIENREKLADRLAVIDCISSEYDYVCTLNADTMDVVVYRAEAWIRDMFKNLEDIVASPQTRDATLRGIVHPDDFDAFQNASRHDNVLRGLSRNGSYSVNYRAYKYGKLVNYQTRYELDKNNPKRIIIGLRELR